MNVNEAIAYIHSANWMGSVPSLDRARNLLTMMGNPEKKLKYVHIAGINTEVDHIRHNQRNDDFHDDFTDDGDHGQNGIPFLVADTLH